MFYQEPDWTEEHKFHAKHDTVYKAKEVDDVMEITVEIKGLPTSMFQLSKEVFLHLFKCIDTDGTDSFIPPKPQVLVDKDWYEAVNLVFRGLYDRHAPYDGLID
jgi:hypothetical protein